MTKHSPNLVLASSSKYKKTLLESLGIPFTSIDPSIDETPQPGESPHSLSLRLAKEKAASIADKNPEALIIGCDQVAVCNSQIIGKPGSKSRAIQQLSFLQNKEATFLTSVALFSKDHQPKLKCATTQVRFRKLTNQQVERYVEIEGVRYSHIIDPGTGLGLTRRIAATVVAPTAVQSDPLATFCCINPELARAFFAAGAISCRIVGLGNGSYDHRTQQFPALTLP